MISSLRPVPQGFFEEETEMDSMMIADRTLKQPAEALSLSFREKIELCKQIDRLNVSVIELQPIVREKADSLLIKSVCSAVEHAAIAVPVQLNRESVQMTWNALKNSRNARLQVSVPVSSVQMEYLMHMKPDILLAAVTETLRDCCACTANVEFIAEDATRSDAAFLRKILKAAAEAGATTVTLCDSAGNLLPEETRSFLEEILRDVPELNRITVGYACSNDLSMADADGVAAIQAGAREIKTEALRKNQISLQHLAGILTAKGASFGVVSRLNTESMNRTLLQIRNLCKSIHERDLPFRNQAEHPMETGLVLTAHDGEQTVRAAAEKLGYELSEEDQEKVWKAFRAVAEKKEQITFHELEAIIAAEAMQVPPAYQVLQYVINTGNTIGAMAHMKMAFHGTELEGISAGDGPIDAAIQSVEQATGRHYELEEFQIQAITEGQEALGETLIKLRWEGKLYSGRGISTDIIGATVMAYVNAMNKIVYEEEDV